MILAAEIAKELARVLEGDMLPAEGRAYGERLAAQLSRPPRVVVMGPAGSGKTSLINMLLGAPLMPQLSGVAVVELLHGPAARVKLQMADGSLLQRDGLAGQAVLQPGVVRIVQERPDARLLDWTFVEVRLDPRVAGQVRLMDWAARHADFAIWCTDYFDPSERQLWTAMPDRVKDHAFLVLSRADRLIQDGTLAGRIAALQPDVAEEFLGLYPVATLQALAARVGAGQDNAWVASGGRALWQKLRDQAELARMADLDQALMLLDRCRSLAATGAGELAAPAVAFRSHAAPVSSPVAAPETPAVVPVAPQPATGQVRQPEVALAVPLDPGCLTVLDRALRRLNRCAEDLAGAESSLAADMAPAVIDRCVTATADLLDILSAPGATHKALDPFRDDVLEAEQMLTLLRLEGQENAAFDALTLMVQIKKDLSTVVAR